jgi:hypothetical protein
MVIVAHPLSVHANPAGAHAAAAVRYPASAVAPIPSVVFVVFPPAWLPAAAHAAAQPLLDFWFQALARSRGNVLDAARVGGNVRDTFDRVLSSQVRSSPAAMDNFDDLFEAVSEKSREGMEIVVTRMCSIPS